MSGSVTRNAVLFALRNNLEHNPAVVYKCIFAGETISLIEKRPHWSCQLIDFDIDDISLTSIISSLSKIPDAILIWSEVHHAKLALQIANLSKQISPNTKVLVFGRATSFIPQYFERHPFDVVHVTGDREATILSFLDVIDGKNQRVAGASMKIGTDDIFIRNSAAYLPTDEWPLPNLAKLPIDKYKKFTELSHGKNYTKRVSVTVSKGCGWNCAYCGASQEEGRIDRRRDIPSLLRWAEESRLIEHGCVLHLYASDLFFDADWILRFTDHYEAVGASFLWRGVTTTRTLQDSRVIKAAAKHGCSELAVGIEHINSKKHTSVKSSIEEIRNAAHLTSRFGISLKGLVMLGYPGQREEDILYIENLADECDISIRYTGYTPLHKLKRQNIHELDSLNLEIYDRRTYFNQDESYLSPSFFYKRISQNGGYYIPNKSTRK